LSDAEYEAVLKLALASQPPPTRSEPRCPSHCVRLANEAFFKCGCRYVAPAPTRSDGTCACGSAPVNADGMCATCVSNPELRPTRTDHEKAKPYDASYETCDCETIDEHARGACHTRTDYERAESALAGARRVIRELNPRVCTDYERAVLDACARVDWNELIAQWRQADVWPSEALVLLADAALRLYEARGAR
jgi:hypothetical protein